MHLNATKAFTYVELLFVLFIISILMYLQTHASLLNTNYTKTNQKRMTQLISHLNLYKSKAIHDQKAIIVLFKKGTNQIEIKEQGATKKSTITLPKGTIMNKSNLDYINFDKKGEVNQFGSVYISYDKEIYRLIFHIEKGRIRYEKV